MVKCVAPMLAPRPLQAPRPSRPMYHLRSPLSTRLRIPVHASLEVSSYSHPDSRTNCQDWLGISRPLVKRRTGTFISPLFSDLALHAASLDTFVTVSGPSRHQYHPETDTHCIVASQSPSSTGAGRAACIACSGAFAFTLRIQTLTILVGASALQACILRHPPTEAGDVYTESRTRLLSWYSQGHAVGNAINLTQPPTIIIALLYPASLLTYSVVVDGIVLLA
ncbi:hypothetical protein BDZ89DRAFT_1085207, partial [Hymenopellis radicata]